MTSAPRSIRTFTIIGGGSAYAPGLCHALLDRAARQDGGGDGDGDGLALTELRLHDLDEAHLAVVEALVRRLAEHRGTGLRVVATTDLATAVRGADVVLNSARPGGFACRQLDESVPVAEGIPGQETVGPGGFFFALRSVPAALAVHAAMTAHAPGAVLLNYTNPTNIVTQALAAAGAGGGGPTVLGLCDQADEDLGALCEALGRPGAPYQLRCVGLNHATWYSDVRIGGEPLGPLPDGLVAPDHLDEEHRIRFELSCELGRRHRGHFPNSYLPYYLAPDRFVAHSRAHGTRTQVIVAGLAAYYDHFRAVTAMAEPKLERFRGSSGFGDLAVRVLDALAAPAPRGIILNVVNRDAAAGFDPTTVVEALVELSANGLVRRPCPTPPDDALPLLRRLERYQRLAAVAAVDAEPAAILDALAANPLVDGAERALALLRRAAAAYGDRLPQLV